MSFFLQSKRNTDFVVVKTPSPFDYSVNPQHKSKSGYAPFSSTSKLNRTASKPETKQKINDFQQDRAFVVDDSNIQILAQQKMQSMFKSRSERIMHSHNNIPGPGSYELRSKYKKEQSKKNQQYTHSISQRKINPPSIPTDNLGYKYNQNSELQKVPKKQSNPPVPGSYELRQKLIKQKGLSWNNNYTTSRKQDQAVIPGPGAYNSNLIMKKAHASTSVFNSQIDRFNPKKIKKVNNPGPGDYNVNQNRQNRQFSETHFNSKAPRFNHQKPSNLGPGLYDKKTQNKSMKTFNKKIIEGQKQNSQAYRKTIFSLNSKNPGPGQYIAREGMTFQLQKALLRKHNFSQFPNGNRQLFQIKNLEDPGPGSYDPILPKGTLKGNIGYKSIEVINLKQDEQIQTPSPLQYTYNNFSMSNKIEQSARRLTLTQKKPFNVGTERFDHYSNSGIKKSLNQRTQTFDTDNNQSIEAETTRNINFEGPKRVKKLIMTSVKVKVPFGTSTNKFQMDEYNDIGPGYYNSGSNWVKPSYSIKSKLSKN